MSIMDDIIAEQGESGHSGAYPAHAIEEVIAKLNLLAHIVPEAMTKPEDFPYNAEWSITLFLMDIIGQLEALLPPSKKRDDA